jgi:hypothetical protein
MEVQGPKFEPNMYGLMGPSSTAGFTYRLPGSAVGRGVASAGPQAAKMRITKGIITKRRFKLNSLLSGKYLVFRSALILLEIG